MTNLARTCQRRNTPATHVSRPTSSVTVHLNFSATLVLQDVYLQVLTLQCCESTSIVVPKSELLLLLLLPDTEKPIQYCCCCHP
jgi:hypothetical protein